MTAYDHTQRSPLGWLVAFLSLALLLNAWLANIPFVSWILTGSGILLMVLAGMFGWLRIRDDGEFLILRYGPVPGFGAQLRYADISKVERTRSWLIDGWGIHCIPGRGWTYNLWGSDCVEVTVGNRRVRVGSDDADNLARFLLEKTSHEVV